MIISALFSWWYGKGWAQLGQRVMLRVSRALGFFSVGILARTLFDPFRQIDAAGVRGSFQVQMRAFFDRSFSRVVGFFLRSMVIVFGLAVGTVLLISGAIQLVVWPLLPFLPLVGLLIALVIGGIS